MGRTGHLVTDAPVEFQKYPVDGQGLRRKKFPPFQRNIYRIYPLIINNPKPRKITPCNRFGTLKE
jgi:hypothetical protein